LKNTLLEPFCCATFALRFEHSAAGNDRLKAKRKKLALLLKTVEKPGYNARLRC
jgi:hypothetical protein